MQQSYGPYDNCEKTLIYCIIHLMCKYEDEPVMPIFKVHVDVDSSKTSYLRYSSPST